MKFTPVISGHIENNELETEHHVLLNSIDEARKHYDIVVDRFLNLNRWHELLKLTDIRFYVNNAFGVHVQREVTTGDYIHIESGNHELPKWLYIDELSEFSNEQMQVTSIYVHPSQNPFEHSTNSLIVSRTESLISIFAAPSNELLVLLQWNSLAKALLNR